MENGAAKPLANRRLDHPVPSVRAAATRERGLLRERDAHRDRAKKLEQQLLDANAQITERGESIAKLGETVDALRGELADVKAKLALIREVIE